MKTVRLTDDTCGRIAHGDVGDYVVVQCREENGSYAYFKGTIAEVLIDDENEDCHPFQLNRYENDIIHAAQDDAQDTNGGGLI
jgi:hypothetical protein